MRALIVGAGIAGDTLAVLLDQACWEVDVVDISPGLRSGGQTVDLRGAAADVLARLGLLDACLSVLVEQRGIAWVDSSGRRLAEMSVDAFGGRGFVSSAELLRTDLAGLLHAAGSDRINYRWSDTVEAIEDTGGAVRVAFRNHDPEIFDVVIGADGTHSRTRSIVFGPEATFRRSLGLAHAWFTLAESTSTPGLDGWYLVHNAPRSKVVEARPGHVGTQEIGFTFPAALLPSRRDLDAQYSLLRSEFAGVGWRTRELISAMPVAADFALDTFDQIRINTWHRGRVVLVGDSAWCASPLSGLGTALALQGAEALAGELTASGIDGTMGLESAVIRFENTMRPIATAAQKLLPGRVRSYAPRTAVGIRTVAALMKGAQSPALASILERVGSGRGY